MAARSVADAAAPASAQGVAGAAGALDHARRFVAHLAARSVDDWREVLQRAHAVDPAAHAAALRRAAEDDVAPASELCREVEAALA